MSLADEVLEENFLNAGLKLPRSSVNFLHDKHEPGLFENDSTPFPNEMYVYSSNGGDTLICSKTIDTINPGGD